MQLSRLKKEAGVDTSPNNKFLAPRYWPIWLAVGLLKLLIKLPYRTQLVLGKWLGRLLALVPSKMRHTTVINLQLCFPELTELQRQQLLRKNFESVGIGIFETALGWWAPDSKIQSLLHAQGVENIKMALAEGKAVMLCGAHFTTLEIAGRLMAQHLPLAVTYRTQKNPVFEKINRAALDKYYQQVLRREEVRGVLRCLKSGLCIWFAADTDAGIKNSVFVPFFDVLAATVTATPRYAKMSNAMVFPVAFYRREDGSGYELIIQPALENFPSDNIEQDVTRLNNVLEAAIRLRPEQYLWQYKRFKTRPIGEKRVY